MEKIAGYGLILVACWAIGEQAAGRLRLHRNRLKQIKNWLSYFRGKLLFEGATVEEAFEESARLAGAPFSVFLLNVATAMEQCDGRPFIQIWETELCGYEHELGFSSEELGEFQRFGQLLGQMDKEVQLRAITALDEGLETALKRTEEEIGVKEKLYRSLGILTGCMIIILIW